jgi:amino acid permease
MRGLADRRLFWVHAVLEVRSRRVTMCLLLPYLGVCPGVIGTGLFLGTANSLRNGGPVGLFLGYIFFGSICFSVMVGGRPFF